MSILKVHIERARPILDWHPNNEFLFIGRDTPRVARNTIALFVAQARQNTIDQNPDLTDLAGKRINPHSMRVSFATLLFGGGCAIRSVNELMMHDSLSTTARYTPIPVEDMRRVCRKAHPRA